MNKRNQNKLTLKEQKENLKKKFDEMFEEEDAEQKVIQINSKSWKGIIDKKKQEDNDENQNDNNTPQDGGFFLSFDSASQ